MCSTGSSGSWGQQGGNSFEYAQWQELANIEGRTKRRSAIVLPSILTAYGYRIDSAICRISSSVNGAALLLPTPSA
jgi:hypothetical protein